MNAGSVERIGHVLEGNSWESPGVDGKAHAALLVRAVNAHGAYESLLEGILDCFHPRRSGEGKGGSMTDPQRCLTVLPLLEEIASRLEMAEGRALNHAAGRDRYQFKHVVAFGYLKTLTEMAAEDLRKDIKLLRESIQPDGDEERS